MKRKITALVLCLAMLLPTLMMPVFAAEFTDSEKSLNMIGEKAIQKIVGGIASIIRDPGWQTEAQYKETHDTSVKSYSFITSPAEGAAWAVGYGSGSLQTGTELTGGCYVGGSLSVAEKKYATAVYDDQRVRTVAMSDGRAITVFSSVDAFGLANSEVLKIREMLADYSAEHNIGSINISSLHQHSCVDTYGMNGDLLGAFFTAPIKNLFGIKNPSGQNPEFMEHFYAAVVKSVKDAVEDMKQGKLYYGAAAAEAAVQKEGGAPGETETVSLIRDKRDPQVIDENVNRLRFVPDAGGRETWLINQAIHCVGMGAGGTTVTGDYPYYMEKYIDENANANFIMIQGAELAITSNNGNRLTKDAALVEEYGSSYAELAALGTKLGEIACSITDSKEIAPILNYKSGTYFVKADNNILLLAAKCGLLTNTIVKSGFGSYSVVTEVGYAEFGNEIAVAIVPGELAPEIAYGGATTAEDSWLGTSWDYKPLEDYADGKKLLVFGITNDQIGYMLTDNSWHSFLCQNEEVVAASSTAGSSFMNSFDSLMK